MKPSRLFFVFAIILLAGCSDLRDDLGLGRSAPDEFAVVDRPPLSMPPDYGLRPPQPGAPRPQDVDTTKKADEVVFGDKTASNVPANASDAEKALLINTGGDKADPNIRQVIDQEAAQKVVGTKRLVDDLLWWKKEPKPGAVVDAPAEAARIKVAKEKGTPINQGATPIIEKQKSGWLGL